jgi:hypothetical protein
MGFWSSAWRAIKTVVRVVIKAVAGGIMRIVHIVGSLADLVYSFEKTMTIQVLILRDSNSQGVIIESDIEPAIAMAKQIFKDKFNVAIKSYGKPMVQTLPNPAPSAALDVKCDEGAFSNEFGEAGEYFANNLAGWVGIPISLAFPVTVYVVHGIKDKIGCSIPITDYVTLSPDGAKSDTTLAHELAHTCLLAHRDNSKNLLYPGIPRGTDVTSWQRWVVRTSRHCTFW